MVMIVGGDGCKWLLVVRLIVVIEGSGGCGWWVAVIAAVIVDSGEWR